MYLNDYTNSLINDNLNVIASKFQQTLSDSNVSKTPISCNENNNKSIANSPDLGQKKGPKPSKVLSHMSRSIQETPRTHKKKVLFISEDNQYLFVTISQASERQRAVLEVIFKHMDDETSTSALLHKTILEAIPGLTRRTLQRELKHWADKEIIHSQQKVHAKAQWGANRYSSIYAASTVRHFLARNSSIKTRVLNNTININSPSKELEVKKRKPSYKSRDPEKIIEVKDAWPSREAQKLLDREAQGYVRQQMIVSDYNALLLSQGKETMKQREYNYGFFPFYKQRKALQAKYGNNRIPLAKSIAWKQKPEIQIKPEIKTTQLKIEEHHLLSTEKPKDLIEIDDLDQMMAEYKIKNRRY